MIAPFTKRRVRDAGVHDVGPPFGALYIGAAVIIGQDIGNLNVTANVKGPPMSLDPLLNAPTHLQVHAGAAMLAICIGPFSIYRRRRDIWHKTLGYIWVMAMAIVALSSFFIHSFAVIGPFSPLHGLAVLTLWSLWRGISSARAGQIAVHRATFQSLYWYELGWGVIGVGAIGLITYAMWGRLRDAKKGRAQARSVS